jgi:hypothetical protein
MIINVIGVDPGPTTGIAILHWRAGDHGAKPLAVWHGYQCDAGSAKDLLRDLLRLGDEDWYGEIEHFVPSKLPGSPVTVQLEDELSAVAESCGVHLDKKPMASVKPWCSARRMEASRAWATIPVKMVDARAAAKHCLYRAVGAAGVLDPLTRGGRPE